MKGYSIKHDFVDGSIFLKKRRKRRTISFPYAADKRVGSDLSEHILLNDHDNEDDDEEEDLRDTHQPSDSLINPDVDKSYKANYLNIMRKSRQLTSTF